MTINDNNNNFIPFEKISKGQAFQHDGHFYIKGGNGTDDNFAVDLSNGAVYYFSPYVKIEWLPYARFFSSYMGD